MPVILASQRWVSKTPHGHVTETLDQSWAHFCTALGWSLIPAFTGQDERKLFESLQPHALLLTGGNDLSQVNTDPLCAGRDSWEKRLLDEALKRKLPVIGICRGMQFLVASLGGSLVAIDGHAAEKHAIVAAPEVPKDLDAQWFTRDFVPSFHDWGVSDLPAGMKALAFDIEGHVEACISECWQALGLLWHPERNPESDERDIALIQQFLALAA